MIAREILRFFLTALVTFPGATASQWWSGDPCRTQYLEALWRMPEYGLLGICHSYVSWVESIFGLAVTIAMYVAIGFVLVGRGLQRQIVAVLSGVFAGVVAFECLMRFAMLQTDVWRHGAYSPPDLLDIAISGLTCAAIAAVGVWMRRSRARPKDA